MVNFNSFYSREYDFDLNNAGPTKEIMLAAVPRVGSSFIGIELWRQGVFGAPLEYLNIHNRKNDLIPRLGANNLEDYWGKIKKIRTGRNGVFSYKLFIQDLSYINSHEPSLIPRIGADYVVRLKRRNISAQAISYCKAVQTNEWFFQDRPRKSSKYSREALDAAMRWINELDLMWEIILRENKCTPLIIYYEDFVRQPKYWLETIAEFAEINLDGNCRLSLPMMRIQANSESVRWAKKFSGTRGQKTSLADRFI